MSSSKRNRSAAIYNDITSPHYRKRKTESKQQPEQTQVQQSPIMDEDPMDVPNVEMEFTQNMEEESNNNENNIRSSMDSFIDLILEPTDGEEDQLPLFDGLSKMTLRQFHHRILKFIVQFKPPKVLLQEFLKIISELAPKEHRVPSSLHKFNKILDSKQHQCHDFCEDCQYIFKKEAEIYCPNCLQYRGLLIWRYKEGSKALKAKKRNPKTYFMTFSVQEQLKRLLETDGNLQLVQQYNRKASDTKLSDIKDGSFYQTHYDSGFLKNKNNMSMIGFTDGVQPFNSSSKTLWPVFFAINELPAQKRFKTRNILLAGVYFGKEKPNMTGFLRPIINELEVLATKGIIVEPSPDEKHTCCAKLICGVFDSVARSWIMCMKNYNFIGEGESTSGCGRCIICAVRQGSRTVYPYQAKITERNSEAVKDTLKQNSDECFKGISVLWELDGYNFFLSTIIDPMHCLWEGIMKKFLKRWFDKSHSKEPGSQRAQKKHKTLDELLSQVKLPMEYKRNFRSYKDHGAYWKASELKNFMLIALPCVGAALLPPIYFQHFMRLVNAVSILTQREIERSHLTSAMEELEAFCSGIEELYGSSMESFNVHQSRHLIADTERFGPLWTHSAFVFESMNHEVMKMCHGTRKLLEQMVWFQEVRDTLSKFEEQQEQQESNKVSSNIELLGAGKTHDLSKSERKKIKSYLKSEGVKGYQITKATKYSRVKLKRQQLELHTADHDAKFKTNNSCVQLADNSFALLQAFYILDLESGSKNLTTAVVVQVTPLKKQKNKRISPFVHEVTLQEHFNIFNVNKITEKLIWINFNQQSEEKNFVVSLQTNEV